MKMTSAYALTSCLLRLLPPPSCLPARLCLFAGENFIR